MLAQWNKGVGASQENSFQIRMYSSQRDGNSLGVLTHQIADPMKLGYTQTKVTISGQSILPVV